jgi:mRNA-degrading endonuclease RelE of RelBE toxin-antitoxin system
VLWSPQARADIRAIDQPAAIRILESIDRYLVRGAGDVKQLQDRPELRLRVGDYRVLFEPRGDAVIEVKRARHRREAYRD